MQAHLGARTSKSTTPKGAPKPQGVDEIEISGVFSAAAADVLALDATGVFSADITDDLLPPMALLQA